MVLVVKNPLANAGDVRYNLWRVFFVTGVAAVLTVRQHTPQHPSFFIITEVQHTAVAATMSPQKSAAQPCRALSLFLGSLPTHISRHWLPLYTLEFSFTPFTVNYRS